MVLSGIVIAGGLTAAAALITTARVLGIKRMIKHSTLVDATVTVGLGAALMGTATGMLTAIIAGLIVALTLSVAKVASNIIDDRTLWKRKDDQSGSEYDNINHDVYTRGMSIC